MEDGAEPDGLVAPVVTGLGHSLDVSAEFVAAWRAGASALFSGQVTALAYAQDVARKVAPYLQK